MSIKGKGPTSFIGKFSKIFHGICLTLIETLRVTHGRLRNPLPTSSCLYLGLAKELVASTRHSENALVQWIGMVNTAESAEEKEKFSFGTADAASPR